MQNFDFYESKGNRASMPSYDRVDPEYFSRTSAVHNKEAEKHKKKTSRAIFFIIALNIITFTTGLILGLKFAGGEEREIVDPTTYKTVAEIGKKVSDIVNDPNEPRQKQAAKLYPREEYPYVVKIGADHKPENAQAAAEFLSKKGHTVILSKNGSMFRVFAGPFKTKSDAQRSIHGIESYKNEQIGGSAVLLKR